MGMDEKNKEGPRVHLFGAEVNGGDWDGKGKAEAKEEWKMHRRAWHDEHHHGGGVFWGILLLFLGVIALFDTMGFISHSFWHAIVPFWPILLILWGASIILGRHWFARFILFLFALVFLVIVILYGLVRSDSPLVSSLSPNVVQAVQN
jgi:hypothetical protein